MLGRLPTFQVQLVAVAAVCSLGASKAEAGGYITYGNGYCAGKPATAIFKSEDAAPPLYLAPGQSASVSMSFANCSTQTWVAGQHNLGSQSSQDNTTWGTNRIALPGNVPPGYVATFTFNITAPIAEGVYTYHWAMVWDGHDWIRNESSAAHTILVRANLPSTVQLCPGQWADPRGGQSASAAINACINQGTTALPPGVYLITAGLSAANGYTLRTQGTTPSQAGCMQGGPACAVLLAGPSLSGGLLGLGMAVDHLVIDGNRGARLASSVATGCATGNGWPGANGAVWGSPLTFTNNAVVNALCSTGLAVVADGATITGNLVQNNGDHYHAGMWADGLTVKGNYGLTIQNNVFRNNTDIDLIVGGATTSHISFNTIQHTTQTAFAGLMLDNFQATTSGDFTGSAINNNSVDCGWAFLCDFGMNIGPHPWYVMSAIKGGSVYANTIAGARVGLNVDGAGTCASPLYIGANTVSGAAAGASIGACTVGAAANYNIAPDALVTANSDLTGFQHETYHRCYGSGYERDRMGPGEDLSRGQMLTSAPVTGSNGRYHASLQDGDGNFVVYNPSWLPDWTSGKQGGNRVTMQTDGNYVQYGPYGWMWMSATWRSPQPAYAYAVMQPDGNLVVYHQQAGNKICPAGVFDTKGFLGAPGMRSP